jgi:hypothetical protein
MTPPRKLLKQWEDDWFHEQEHADVLLVNAYAAGAQAGADMELEACCEVLHQHDRAYLLPSQLRAARRPKPPSLKEQALEALETLNQAWIMPKELDAVITIRQALEALPND